MANGRVRGSGVFRGVLLIVVGVLLLLHNYRDFEISNIFLHWWPAILILWGAVKLYERTAAARSGDPGAARVSGGEIGMVVGLLALVGVLVAAENVHKRYPGFDIDLGNSNSFDLDVAPKTVPADARITIRGGRGDITVHSADEPMVRVSGKKNVKSWNDTQAQRVADRVSVDIAQNGDGYEIHPTGINDSRTSVDLDVTVPKQAELTVRNERGDIDVSDAGRSVMINGPSGDIEVSNTSGDVSIDMRRGDAKISDTKGNVRISGAGDAIEVSNATGSLTLNGEFAGPIRADKVAKGVQFTSHRTDLTLTQLGGHLELGSGNLDVVDAPGNLALRTRDYDVSIENAGGKVRVDNRNGSVELRFSSPPKDDIEINDASASITLSLPESSSFDIVADSHSGEINSEFSADSLKQTKSNSGDSHLEGKYGAGRGPKIILKTTYGSISIHKIS